MYRGVVTSLRKKESVYQKRKKPSTTSIASSSTSSKKGTSKQQSTSSLVKLGSTQTLQIINLPFKERNNSMYKSSSGKDINIEETQNEKLLDLYTNIKGGGILTGVKTFPQLKTEIGDNEKMIKRLLCKFNKNKNRNNDNIVISETCTVRLNVSEYDDDMDECKKIFGSVPKKSVLPSFPRYNKAIKLCKKNCY